MKSNLLSLLAAGAMVVSIASCGGNTQQAKEQKTEKSAVEQGIPSKNLLTEELKQETTQFLKDLPDSDLPCKIATKEVEVSVSNASFMLPVAAMQELNTTTQKARVLGIYFADKKLLEANGKPTKEHDEALAKLVSDLNISFVLELINTPAPKNPSKVELAAFLNDQEDALIDLMMTNDKCDLLLEIMGGMSVEYAYIYSDKGLVVKGDATSAGLSDNMMKRLESLKQIASDLSVYYSDLKKLGDLISPLPAMLETVNMARSNNLKIGEIRAELLK